MASQIKSRWDKLKMESGRLQELKISSIKMTSY